MRGQACQGADNAANETAGTTRSRPAQVVAGEQMKRIRTSMARIRRERRWPEDLPDDPRDPDVVRAKALARPN